MHVTSWPLAHSLTPLIFKTHNTDIQPFFVVPCHSFSLLVTFLFTFLVIPSHSLIIHSISHCYLSFLIPDVMLSCHSFSSSLSYLERLLETITGECAKVSPISDCRIRGVRVILFSKCYAYFRSEMKWYAFRVSFAAGKKTMMSDDHDGRGRSRRGRSPLIIRKFVFLFLNIYITSLLR